MNTTALTTDQVALNNYISEMNAEFDVRMRSEGATFWTSFALNANDLAEYGVTDVAQFKVWLDENNREEAAKEERKNSYGW
jgi:hypothetical protein